MTKFYDPVFTDAVKDVIGDEPVLDQFDIDYAASFYGSTADDYVTGTMLVETNVGRSKRFRTFVTGTRPRGRAVSKYYAGEESPAEGAAGTAEVSYNPLQSFREVPWSARVSRTAYRIAQAFDSKERFYDSCLPNLSKCFEADGDSNIWTVKKTMGPGYETLNESRIWPLLSPVGNVVTESAGFMYFNGGGINLDRPEDGFSSGLEGNNAFSNNDWTWSYPYEAKYRNAERAVKNTHALGLNANYIADWDGYNFKSITSSIERPKRIKHFMPILPGKVRPDILGGFGGRNTFRSEYKVTGTYGYKSQMVADPLNPNFDDMYGMSYLFPSDMNLYDSDDRTNWLEPWRAAFGPGFFERPGPEPLTGSMTFDDTVRFLFGFGDLNNMTYSRRLLEPSIDLLHATGTFSLSSPVSNFSDGETVTIDSTVYTFRTALTPTAGEVLIETSGTGSLQNFIDAMILKPSTSGTKYVPTITYPNVTPEFIPGSNNLSVRVRVNTAGYSTFGFATQDTCANASWQTATMRNGRGIDPRYWITTSGMSELNTSWLERGVTSAAAMNATLVEASRIDTLGLKTRWIGATNPRAWKWVSAAGVLTDPSNVFMTGSKSGVKRRFNHLSGSLLAPTKGIFWHAYDPIFSTFPTDAGLVDDIPGGPWSSIVLASDTDTTSGGDMTANGPSSDITLEVTSDYPWTLTYDRAIGSNFTSSLEITLSGERNGEFTYLDVLTGSASGISVPEYNFAVMEQNDLRVNGMSSSISIGWPRDGYRNQTWLARSPYPYPIDPGKYNIKFSFIYRTGAGAPRPEPNRAVVSNIRIIQYTPKSFLPDSGSLVGANNYPVFRNINRDHRIDAEELLGGAVYSMPYTFPSWNKPSKEVVDRYTSAYKFYTLNRINYDKTTYPYNALIHSGTLFGVSPVIRGWKYGLYSGFPANTKVVFRRGSYGQFRDMLEQRQYSKFVDTESSVFDDDPLESNESLQDSVTLGITGKKKSKSVEKVLPAAVQVNFVRQRYRRDARGIGEIYNVQVDPALTISQNLSEEVTSSVPYFDGVARHRSEEDYSKVADTQITSFTYADGNLTVT